MGMMAFLLLIQANWRKILVVIGIVVLIGLGLWARSCYVDYKQRQVQEELNIERQKVIDAIVAEEAADVEGKRQDAVNKGQNTSEANKKLDDARSADSSRSNSNASAVKQRFCELYPDDSLCR